MENPFKALFKRHGTSVLGIDIGSSAIKIVQLKKKGNRAVLETYGALALGPYSGVEVGRATNLPEEKVIEALLDILKEAKATTKTGGMAIPFSSSLVSVIEMPALGDKQLAQMVPIEARKYIPVPISEVVLDWTVIPRDQYRPEESEARGTKAGIPSNQESSKLAKTDVLVIAIHNDTIKDYQNIVAKASLDVGFFEIEIFSTLRSVLDQSVEPTMIMDMGAASTKLYIVERGSIRNSHTINRGSQDVTLAISRSLGIAVKEAEILKRKVGLSGTVGDGDLKEVVSLNLEYVFSETKAVLVNYQKKYGKSVSKIILVGGGVAMKGFSELAGSHLQMTVISGDPFSKVETPAFLTEVLKNTGPEFAVAVGVALRKIQEL